MAGLINRCVRRVAAGSLNSSRRTRLPSFEMAQPPNRAGDDTDMDTLDSKSAFPTPRLPDDLDDGWSSPPPITRKYTIKGGVVQQVTGDEESLR